MRKWISFRELFQDEDEPSERGISLENPIFEEGCVVFAVTSPREIEMWCERCKRSFRVDADFTGVITCPYCGMGVE